MDGMVESYVCVYILITNYIFICYIFYIYTHLQSYYAEIPPFFFWGGFKIIAVCDVSSTSRLYYLVHCPVEPGQFWIIISKTWTFHQVPLEVQTASPNNHVKLCVNVPPTWPISSFHLTTRMGNTCVLVLTGGCLHAVRTIQGVVDPWYFKAGSLDRRLLNVGMSFDQFKGLCTV